MTPDISLATPKDIPDILPMMRKLCAFHGDTCQIGLADAQAQLIDRPGLTAIVARAMGKPLGYAVMEAHWRPMDAGDALDIAHLFVIETRRGHGIGSAMVSFAREHARTINASRLTIGTAPDNPGAAAAYRAMGLDEMIGPTGARFRIAI